MMKQIPQTLQMIRPGDFNRILVVKTHGLGDVLMTTPALRALRHRFPNANITYMVGSYCREILLGNPNTDEIIGLQEGTLFSPKPFALLRLASRLMRKRFDLAILFSRSPALHLLILMALIPVRVGFIKNRSSRYLLTTGLNPSKGPDWRRASYEVNDNIALVKLVGAQSNGPPTLDLFFDNKDILTARQFLNQHRRHPKSLLVGICPGGSSNPSWDLPEKLWPSANYSALADFLIDNYAVEIIWLGGPEDRSMVHATIAEMKRLSINGCGRFNLKQTGAIFKECALIITNDSIPIHLALALKVPAVVLFGPTNPCAVAPHQGDILSIKSPLGCSPCFWQAMPSFQTYPGRNHFPGCHRESQDFACMKALTFDIVCQQIQAFMERLHRLSSRLSKNL